MSRTNGGSKKQRSRKLVHFKTTNGAMCGSYSGTLVSDPPQLSCGRCRARLARRGVPITRIHLRSGGRTLCKVENDPKRMSNVASTVDLHSVTCRNCKRIADDMFRGHRERLAAEKDVANDR